jgi:hypothetical protein
MEKDMVGNGFQQRLDRLKAMVMVCLALFPNVPEKSGVAMVIKFCTSVIRNGEWQNKKKPGVSSPRPTYNFTMYRYLEVVFKKTKLMERKPHSAAPNTSKPSKREPLNIRSEKDLKNNERNIKSLFCAYVSHVVIGRGEQTMLRNSSPILVETDSEYDFESDFVPPPPPPLQVQETKGPGKPWASVMSNLDDA